jgi:hypothetical protein
MRLVIFIILMVPRAGSRLRDSPRLDLFDRAKNALLADFAARWRPSSDGIAVRPTAGRPTPERVQSLTRGRRAGRGTPRHPEVHPLLDAGRAIDQLLESRHRGGADQQPVSCATVF